MGLAEKHRRIFDSFQGIKLSEHRQETGKRFEELQKQLLQKANRNEQYDDLVEEIYKLREEKQQILADKAEMEGVKQSMTSSPDWEFVSVYTDEGLSGTGTKKREGFNRMIKDALDGKIDLILTKSVSALPEIR